jgi:hypothetical protein
MSHIKTDIFKYVSTDVEQAFTIARQEAEKRYFETQSIKTRIKNQSESSTRPNNDALELPGFTRDTLETRYTSRFFLNKPGTLNNDSPPVPITIKNVHLNLPAENWLVLGPGAFKEEELNPLEKLWQEAKARSTASSAALTPGSKTIHLASLVFKDSSKYPDMNYFSPEAVGRFQEAVKKIEKKIAAETERFTSNINRTISSSKSISSSMFFSSVPQAVLSQMADNVYNLILERVKKERKMRGYV